MLTIGVIGDENGIVAEVITEILAKNKTDFYWAAAENSDGVRRTFMQAVIEKAKVFLLEIIGDDYENLSGLKFDILLLLPRKMNEEIVLRRLLKEKNFLIINSDDTLPKKIETTGETMVITCGFNHTASVTVSSVEWEFANKIQCCLQRTLLTVDGGKIEPQEIEYTRHYNEKDIANILAAVAAAVISGAKI